MLKRCALVGHRGGSFACPENTLASILWAFTHGADGVEMDLQQTADGKIILLHDDTLERTAVNSSEVANFDELIKSPVSKLQLEQLRDIDIGSWKDPSFSAERLITFEESLKVLKDVGDDKYYLVEVKGGDFAILPELKLAVQRSGARESQIIWIGFDLALMAELKKEFPTFKVFHVVMVREGKVAVDPEQEKEIAMRMVDEAKAANLDGIDFESNPEAITPEILSYAHGQGLEIGVWVWSSLPGSDSPESLAYFTANHTGYFTSNMPPEVLAVAKAPL